MINTNENLGSTLLFYFCDIFIKPAYYITVVHNFDLQEKNYFNIEITTNFVKRFKAHFEKKLLNKARITSFEVSKYFIENDLCMHIAL